MNEEKKTHINESGDRKTNIELLRIIAILFVIIFHFGNYVLKDQLQYATSSVTLEKNVFQYKLIILEVTQSFGQIGNDIFVLISGYFLIERKKINIYKSAKKILLQLGFVAVLITILSFIYYKFVSKDFTGLVGVSVFNTEWWFAGYYIGIITVAYFLNPKLNIYSREHYLSLIIVLFSFASVGFLGGLLEDWMSNFRRFVTGVMIYCLGGYIKKYEPFKRIKGIVLFLLIFVILALFILSYYNTVISNFNISMEREGAYVQTVDVFKVFSVVPFLISVILFELFTRIEIKTIPIINSLAVSSFMVYILHDNVFVRSVANEYNMIDFFYEHTGMFVAFWGALSVAMLGIGFVVNLVYNRMMNVIGLN